MSEVVFVAHDAMYAIPVPESLKQGYAPDMQQAMDRAFTLRRKYFPDEITFHAPGLRRYKTAGYTDQDHRRFVSISLACKETDGT